MWPKDGLKHAALQDLANYCPWLVKRSGDWNNVVLFLLPSAVHHNAELQMLISKLFLNTAAVELTSATPYSNTSLLNVVRHLERTFMRRTSGDALGTVRAIKFSISFQRNKRSDPYCRNHAALVSVCFLECPLKIQGEIWKIECIATLSTDTVTLPFIHSSPWVTAISRLHWICWLWMWEILERQLDWMAAVITVRRCPSVRAQFCSGLYYLRRIYFLFTLTAR